MWHRFFSAMDLLRAVGVAVLALSAVVNATPSVAAEDAPARREINGCVLAPGSFCA
jgi:hypothetical protein